MNDTTTATATATATAATATAAAATAATVAKRNYFVAASEEDKLELTEICESFIGPALSKPTGKAMTEKEGLNLLLRFAVAHRYTFQPSFILSDDGEEIPELDIDGVEVMKSIDGFALEAKRVFALRPTAPEKVDLSSPASIRAQMAILTERLAKADAAAAAMANLGWQRK